MIKDLSMKLSDIVILVDNRIEGNNLKEYIQDKLKIKNIKREDNIFILAKK